MDDHKDDEFYELKLVLSLILVNMTSQHLMSWLLIQVLVVVEHDRTHQPTFFSRQNLSPFLHQYILVGAHPLPCHGVLILIVIISIIAA